MDIKLNQKIIKDMCGAVSFKRGEAFYRANKVTFESYHPDGCEATVKGMEDFHVTIEVDAVGGFRRNAAVLRLLPFKGIVSILQPYCCRFTNISEMERFLKV